ncbi:hypothetical protein BCR36DRAFT_588157, partial [Piromyces finnis]
MSNQNNKKEMSLFDSFNVSVAKYIESLSLWKKELQMILFSSYIILSCISTLIDHIIHYNTELSLKLVDILVFIVMFVLIFVNIGFIYGCFTKNRILLFLTPAIPNFILIYVFFPKFHAFFLPLNEFLKANGLQNSMFSTILNNLGSLTLFRIIYLLPITIYFRFLFNNYTDEFIECLEEIIKVEKKEAEEKKQAQKIAEETDKTDVNDEKNITDDSENKKN